ncbi:MULTISPECIES: FMN-binding negative transcriptional regulator [Marivita]|uniref:FMN-binding negative transcriptional regulator n=1 Tax=Marivita cryptomonadis TaxID=505252 RepID=A0A9Q2NVN3_9RHOB|nr:MULTISPECIES: FMN-binding negative transcriptional regulator [Marivita]MBM2319765.1 FMN-binding negative transcriptional regulator [Marivita cryptomonadis]MBM2329344.1 FMN-binding negative transcriptional regulator [Marivita cryptomonadis]MBM2338932.1 FMN-binding negative transcriptional regulator [Marivita cryptomonadis]MBM2343590.1 FMN-binding negative transcriptional regulator [Marivita cryptomonadis]MBM2348267.1 FMN-binding negative transcriptional regulator [Marivita cryptomonadis]
MHPNPSFHSHDHAKDIALVRNRGFGTLMVNGDPVPMVAHVPVLLSEDGCTVLIHLVRSNPIARALKTPLPARIAVTGPDAYISPDWYGVADQVPTWNYVAVQITGVLELLPHEEMRDVLDTQTAHFETQLADKTPWTTNKMTPEVLDKMMRMIVPCRMTVNEIEATWKLGQNKDDAVRLRAAEQVPGGMGTELEALAAMMADPPVL